MMDTIRALPDVYFVAIFILVALFFLWMGWKMQGFWMQFKFRKEKQNIEVDHTKIQKGMKKIWDEEKANFDKEKEKLQNEKTLLHKRLENYRKKIGGLGLFSFVFDTKRLEMLYTLLLENETLEQLLNAKANRIDSQNTQYLKEKFLDIEERQKLMSRIFSDLKIKNYISEILKGEEHKHLPQKNDEKD